MKLKLDENLGIRTADVFRAAGHDVATVAEQSLQAADDGQLFAVCAREQRALVTLDLDFANPLLFAPAAGAGIAVLRVPDLPSGRDLVAAAMRLVGAMETDEIAAASGSSASHESASTCPTTSHDESPPIRNRVDRVPEFTFPPSHRSSIDLTHLHLGARPLISAFLAL